jgi:hypothetical protein
VRVDVAPIAVILRKILLLTCLCAPMPVFAYVDPGSGMLLWQGLLAALGVVIAFVRNPWQVIKSIMNKFRRK